MFFWSSHNSLELLRPYKNKFIDIPWNVSVHLKKLSKGGK
jgi:hypothetical protein